MLRRALLDCIPAKLGHALLSCFVLGSAKLPAPGQVELRRASLNRSVVC